MIDVEKSTKTEYVVQTRHRVAPKNSDWIFDCKHVSLRLALARVGEIERTELDRAVQMLEIVTETTVTRSVIR